MHESRARGQGSGASRVRGQGPGVRGQGASGQCQGSGVRGQGAGAGGVSRTLVFGPELRKHCQTLMKSMKSTEIGWPQGCPGGSRPPTSPWGPPRPPNLSQTIAFQASAANILLYPLKMLVFSRKCLSRCSDDFFEFLEFRSLFF